MQSSFTVTLFYAKTISKLDFRTIMKFTFCMKWLHIGQGKCRRKFLQLLLKSLLHSGLRVKQFILPIIDFRALLLREQMWHGKLDGIKVSGQFSWCLEAATRKFHLKQLFFWSWINPWNCVWTRMPMLNFNNKELIQNHLIQGTFWSNSILHFVTFFFNFLCLFVAVS